MACTVPFRPSSNRNASLTFSRPAAARPHSSTTQGKHRERLIGSLSLETVQIFPPCANCFRHSAVPQDAWHFGVIPPFDSACSHVPRGNNRSDAPRPVTCEQDAERPEITFPRRAWEREQTRRSLVWLRPRFG